MDFAIPGRWEFPKNSQRFFMRKRRNQYTSKANANFPIKIASISNPLCEEGKNGRAGECKQKGSWNPPSKKQKATEEEDEECLEFIDASTATEEAK
jgi:hypothetical protein